MILAQKQTHRSMEANRNPRNKPMCSINLWQKRQDYIVKKYCWENWTVIYKIIRLDYSLTSHVRITSKWIKDLNVRPETIKLLEENIGNMLFNMSLSNTFLDVSSGKRNKSKNKQMDCIKLKSFCRVKLLTKWKGCLLNRRRYLQMIYLIRG